MWRPRQAPRAAQGPVRHQRRPGAGRPGQARRRAPPPCAFIKATEIAAVQRRLKHTPTDLQQLRGADVQFILVESYGVHRVPQPRAPGAGPIQPRRLHRADGPARLLHRQQHHRLLHLRRRVLAGPRHPGQRRPHRRRPGLRRHPQRRPLPSPWPSAFGSAGYRSVVVQPGTTRRFPEGEVRGFAGKYYAPDLDYQGPPFGWATMPDQYVIDFIHRKEIARPRVPVFAQFALVSSHAPWSVQPPRRRGLVGDRPRQDLPPAGRPHLPASAGAPCPAGATPTPNPSCTTSR